MLSLHIVSFGDLGGEEEGPQSFDKLPHILLQTLLGSKMGSGIVSRGVLGAL